MLSLIPPAQAGAQVPARRPKRKKPHPGHWMGFCLLLSLTITYFHTGCSTIIGAKSFHGPVRDGKGWYRLAMVIRHNLYGSRSLVRNVTLNLEEVFSVICSVS